jgi:hypothetical protein
VDYLTLLATVAPVFLIIAAGYGIRRVGWLDEQADASLMRVIVNLLYPCLILDTILGNRALDEPGNVLLAPLVGFGTVVLGYALCYLAAPAFQLREPRRRRTFAFTAGCTTTATSLCHSRTSSSTRPREIPARQACSSFTISAWRSRSGPSGCCSCKGTRLPEPGAAPLQ